MSANETESVWRVHGDGDPVVEVWESWSGSLWLITKVEGDGRAFGYARLAQCPQFAEWGTINYAELESNPKIWKISRENWSNINTYEDGLLVRD